MGFIFHQKAQKCLGDILLSAFSAGEMAKRNADKELTDRNWDQEEEGEEVSWTRTPSPVRVIYW